VILDKGLVIDAFVRVSLVGIERDYRNCSSRSLKAPPSPKVKGLAEGVKEAIKSD
jgi:hypothetical protein